MVAVEAAVEAALGEAADGVVASGVDCLPFPPPSPPSSSSEEPLSSLGSSLAPSAPSSPSLASLTASVAASASSRRGESVAALGLRRRWLASHHHYLIMGSINLTPSLARGAWLGTGYARLAVGWATRTLKRRTEACRYTEVIPK